METRMGKVTIRNNDAQRGKSIDDLTRIWIWSTEKMMLYGEGEVATQKLHRDGHVQYVETTEESVCVWVGGWGGVGGRNWIS